MNRDKHEAKYSVDSRSFLDGCIYIYVLLLIHQCVGVIQRQNWQNSDGQQLSNGDDIWLASISQVQSKRLNKLWGDPSKISASSLSM